MYRILDTKSNEAKGYYTRISEAEKDYANLSLTNPNLILQVFITDSGEYVRLAVHRLEQLGWINFEDGDEEN